MLHICNYLYKIFFTHVQQNVIHVTHIFEYQYFRLFLQRKIFFTFFFYNSQINAEWK